MNRSAFFLAVFAGLITGCTPWLGRGEFNLVSSSSAASHLYEPVSTEPVTGEGCFTGRQADDMIFSWAVQDALSNPEAEGATALLDATFSNHVEFQETRNTNRLKQICTTPCTNVFLQLTGNNPKHTAHTPRTNKYYATPELTPV